MKYIAIAFIAAFVMTACCKADCIGKEVFVDFDQFRATETDTLWLVRYKAGSFSEPLDTARQYYPVQPTDTGRSSVTEIVYGTNNWKLILPSLNREFVFSNFSFIGRNCCGERVEGVKEFDMNGRRHAGYSISVPR